LLTVAKNYEDTFKKMATWEPGAIWTALRDVGIQVDNIIDIEIILRTHFSYKRKCVIPSQNWNKNLGKKYVLEMVKIMGNKDVILPPPVKKAFKKWIKLPQILNEIINSCIAKVPTDAEDLLKPRGVKNLKSKISSLRKQAGKQAEGPKVTEDDREKLKKCLHSILREAGKRGRCFVFSDIVKSKRLAWFAQEEWTQEAAGLGIDVPKENEVKWTRRTCAILKALNEVRAQFPKEG